jgi:hypothetical protein
MWSEIVISNIPEELYCIAVVEGEDFLRKSQQGMLAVDDCAAAGKQIPIHWLSCRLPSHHIDWAAVNDHCAVKQAFV